jgi:hypothetical protein
VDDNDAFQSVERGYTRVGYSTPEDAILEFVVNTSNFSAINGRATGGGVNAVTRSGSNIFHGDAFYYYRDNDFGATNPFSILQTVPTTVFIKPKDKRSQYGGSFNGPLIHDKLFFSSCRTRMRVTIAAPMRQAARRSTRKSARKPAV